MPSAGSIHERRTLHARPVPLFSMPRLDDVRDKLRGGAVPWSPVDRGRGGVGATDAPSMVS